MPLLPAIICLTLTLVFFSRDVLKSKPEKKENPDEKLMKALAEYMAIQQPTKDV